MRGAGFAHDTEGVELGWGLIQRTLSYAKPYRGLFVVSIIFSILVTAGDLTLPYLVKMAIDGYILKQGVVVPASQASESGCRDLGAGACLVLPGQTPPAYGRAPRVYYIADAEAGPRWGAWLDQLKDREGVIVYPHGVTLAPEALVQLPPALRAELRARDWAGLKKLSLLFLLVILGAFLLKYANGLMLTRGGQGVVRDIRGHLYAHLLSLHLPFFHRNPIGKLVTRVTNDVEAISEFFTLVLSTTIKDFLLILGVATLMVRLNARLTLWVMALIPFLLVLSLVFRRYAIRAFRKVRNRLADLNAFLSETLSGIRVVKLLQRESHNDRRFRDLSDRAYRANLESITLFSIFQPFINFLNLLAVGLILWVGGTDVLGGRMTLGTLVAFLAYVQMFYAPITDLAEKYNIFQSAMAGAEKVQALFGVTEKLPVSQHPYDPKHVRGEILVDQVSFGYEDGPDVLHDISLHVEPGQVVALVGHTGAGKSTLVSLLLRLYDPRRGRVLIDGIDLRHWHPAALRRVMALVPQDVFLFSDSVRDNVRLWDPTIQDGRILEALRAVQAEALVRRLPGGLDAVLAERGQTLSVGERQLLAFARALVQDPRILVLDEATSSVDPGTERLIQEALETLLKGRTAVIIAHRLTTIRRADHIVVLHRGRLVEEGTHEELLARRRYYYALYHTQFQTVPSTLTRAGVDASGDQYDPERPRLRR